MDGADDYPGAYAGVDEVIRLADHYRGAANDLLRLTQERGSPRVAPCRLCAVHAIELYLDAFLLKQGCAPDRLRSKQHDLAERANLAVARGLVLRRRTAKHLAAITQGREYLVLRYDPAMGALSPLNRLWATLDEIARKVTAAVAAAPAAA